MLRRFAQHELRTVADLSGVWDFAFLGEVNPDKVKLGAIRYDDRMAIPGSFDATPRYAGKRGLAAYRTTLQVGQDCLYRLVLDGVHHWGRVFVDGQALCDHVGGFTRFHADFLSTRAGAVPLVVLVDNRLDYHRCPLHLEYFDWYHYGGITRGVELHHLGGVWINQVTVQVDRLQPPTVTVHVDYSGETAPGRQELEIRLDDRPLLTEDLRLGKQHGRITRTLKLPGAKLWSPEQPNLHLLQVRLGDDDLVERIGLRTVETRGRQILINGKPQRLLGFNRHEITSQFGHGQPWQLLVSDVQILKDMGVNFIRGSHYPQDGRFLDLCDEAGICVWNESIGWQHKAEHLTDPRFIGAQLNLITEMIAASVNRPSVILWGLLNESHSQDRKCRKGYKTLIDRIRKLDPSRPVTYACNHPWDDLCLDLVDVVSLNTYPGWYWGSPAALPAELDKVVAHLDSQAKCRNKPLIVSEIGAEGLYGFHDWNQDRWSEDYQAEVHRIVIEHLFKTRKRACGLTLWLFNDFRAANDVKKHLGRARGFNNKGVVDEYRRPKLAYHAVKKLYRELGT